MRKLTIFAQAATALLVWTVPSFAGPVFSQATYSATFTFAENPLQTGTRMTLAFDGTYYWSVTGGGSDGVREARYTVGGSSVDSFSPGQDFRSVFTDGSGNLYARSFASSTILKQTSPGVFASHVTVTGGSLDDQLAVVLNGAGNEYVAQNAGTITRWDLSGALIGTVTLSGWTPAENAYPQNRGLAAVGNYYLTYSEGVLSAWNSAGVRLDSTTLVGAVSSFDEHFSYSYANGMFFLEDGGTWRGYNVLGSGPEPTGVPEPATGIFLASGLVAFAVGKFRRK